MDPVLIAGCGYVGAKLAELLQADGVPVVGVRRRWDGARPAGVQTFGADLANAGEVAKLPRAGAIVYAAAAGEFTDAAYERAYVTALGNVLAHAQKHRPTRFIFVSSTGVYGVGQGDWVDEDTPPAADGPFSARRVLEGERLVAASGLPHVILRFGGIYGPGRQSLLDSVRDGTARLAGGAPQWTNRIHRDDCAGALRFLLRHPAPAPLYHGVDDEPAPRDEILTWLAKELGLPPPPFGAAAAAPQRGNRRCRNTRLKAAGYRFVFPTYREGFRALAGVPPPSPDGDHP